MPGIARLFLLLSLLAAPIGARAQSGDAATDARATIERQLDAFAREDEQAAYALAAPGIRERFPDAGQFMEMVRLKYAAVLRHRSVDLGAVSVEGDEARERAVFVDEDNVVWNALYSLHHEADGRWLITGCVIAKSGDQAL